MVILFYKGLTQKLLELCISFWGIESNDKAVMIQTLAYNRSDFFFFLSLEMHADITWVEGQIWGNKSIKTSVGKCPLRDVKQSIHETKPLIHPSTSQFQPLCGISGSLAYVLWSSHSHIPGCTAMGADPFTFQGSCLCSRNVTKYGLEKARPVRRKGKCDSCMFFSRTDIYIVFIKRGKQNKTW